MTICIDEYWPHLKWDSFYPSCKLNRLGIEAGLFTFKGSLGWDMHPQPNIYIYIYIYIYLCATVYIYLCITCVFFLEYCSLSLTKSPFQQPPCHYCKLSIDLGFSFVIYYIQKLFINLVTKHG